jgi:hypothetical protein
MAFSIVGLSLAFFFLFIQWYVGKQADDEEEREMTRRDRRKGSRRSAR